MLQTREHPHTIINRWESILTKSPPDADEIVELGHALALVGDFEQAIGLYDQANQIAPKHPEAFFGRAIALESMTRFHDAYTEYQKVLRVSPNDERARLAANHLTGYFTHLKQNIPYVGHVMDSNQNPSNERPPFMRQVVKDEVRSQGRESFFALEVGSWAGGSALKWANAIAAHHNRQGKVFCVDGWRAYHDNVTHATYGYSRMNWACKTGEIYRLFLHNVRAAGFDDLVHPLKGSSSEILPMLKDEQFHFIYVDGSHLYTDALYDTEEAIRLVADGGVIAGDDMELQLHECDPALVDRNIDKDLAFDEKRNMLFHPGVTKVVAEKFGEVLNYKGFWAVRRVGDGWEPVEITPDEDTATGY